MIYKIASVLLIFTNGYLFADNCGTEKLLPKECKNLLPSNGKPISVCVADLNGDSTNDYLIAFQYEKKVSENETDNSDRELFIITNAGKYSIAAQNEKILMCSTCGGLQEDPLQGIMAKKKKFTVIHNGGSSDRWTVIDEFAYSNRDKKWQLIKVENTTYSNLQDPGKTMQTTIEKPPKDFGLINFEDFDPNNYQGRGEK